MAFLGLGEHIEKLVKDILGYVNTKIDHLQLIIIKKVTEEISKLLRAIAIGIVLIIFTGILSLAVALYLGEQLGTISYGFFIVAGFYFLILLILIIARKGLFNHRVLRKVSKEILDLRKTKF